MKVFVTTFSLHIDKMSFVAAELQRILNDSLYLDSLSSSFFPLEEQKSVFSRFSWVRNAVSDTADKKKVRLFSRFG
jgi:hypothetical protein